MKTVNLKELKAIVKKLVIKEMEGFEVSPETMQGASAPTRPERMDHISGVPSGKPQTNVEKAVAFFVKKGVSDDILFAPETAKVLGATPEEVAAAVKKFKLMEKKTNSLKEMIRTVVSEVISELKSE